MIHLAISKEVTNAKNEKLWQWEGDAFGDVQPQVEHVKMPLRMAGQYADDEVGLFYNYFRFYNPETGRYIENDPIDLQGGLNRYGYVGGSPLHGIDPKGLIVKWSGSYNEGSVGTVFPLKFLNVFNTKFMEFNLKSECKNNREYEVVVKASGWVFSSDFSLLGPISLGSGGATFYENSDTPNPSSFNGNFALAQAAIFKGVGESYTPAGAIVLGRNLGDLSGIGYSTDLYAIEMGKGKSVVISVKENNCCE